MVVLIVIALAGAFLYAFLRPPASEPSAANAEAGTDKDPLTNIQL